MPPFFYTFVINFFMCFPIKGSPNVQSAAEKRAIIKPTIITSMYLQNYKNIILKYTTKLVTFSARRLQSDLHPCASTALALNVCFPSRGTTHALGLWRFLSKFSVSVRQYFVGDEHKLCSLSSSTENSHKPTNQATSLAKECPQSWI
jgi:hypothetical protein